MVKLGGSKASNKFIIHKSADRTKFDSVHSQWDIPYLDFIGAEENVGFKIVDGFIDDVFAINSWCWTSSLGTNR